MSLGETVQLTTTVLDQNRQPVADAVVSWTSSDEAVATVSGQGLVTAVSNGSVTITARSGTASASIPITVMQSAGSIVIEPPAATLMTLGETVQLTATVLDQNGQPVAQTEVAWSSSDETVATVTAQGLISAVKNGTAQITARVGSAATTINVTVMDDSRDREALTALYNSTDGANWTVSTNWLTERPLGEWYGVGTGSNGQVTALRLHENNLRGPIPTELTQLDNLRYLILSDNRLTGSIPSEIGRLQNLRSFVLWKNHLKGPIPPEFAQLQKLELLTLFWTP